MGSFLSVFLKKLLLVAGIFQNLKIELEKSKDHNFSYQKTVQVPLIRILFLFFFINMQIYQLFLNDDTHHYLFFYELLV